MNNAYDFNLYIKVKLLIKATFSSSLEWPLYTGLTVFVIHTCSPLTLYQEYVHMKVPMFCVPLFCISSMLLPVDIWNVTGIYVLCSLYLTENKYIVSYKQNVYSSVTIRQYRHQSSTLEERHQYKSMVVFSFKK